MLQKKHLRIIHVFFCCVLICLTALSINSCKKTDTLVKNNNETLKERNVENFFKLPANTSPVLQRIAKELEKQNKTNEFIKAFIAKEGFPIWDKARIEKHNQKNNTSNLDGIDGVDTIIYIPLVVNSQRYVHGFLKATVTDTVDIRIFRQNDYLSFPFETLTPTTSVTTAENYAIRMMCMDRDVFGNTEFKLADKRMFHISTDYSDTANVQRFIKLDDSTGIGGDDTGFGFTGGNSSNYQYQICYEVWVYSSNCGINFSGTVNNTTPCGMTWHTENLCTMFESGGGGSGWPIPPGGGQGGSGGGGTNTSCFPGGENIVNGFIPIECAPGPGNNPWPPVPQVVQSLQVLFSLNPIQIDWLIHNLSRANEIFYYLNVSNGSQQLAKDHLNKMMEDNSYLSFANNHSETGDDTKMWWEDEIWLDDPNNFNLDITRSPTELSKLNAAEKALVGQFPIQAFLINKNVPIAFAQSNIVYGIGAPGLNDKKDAFRHAFFNAINTRDCPPQLFPVVLSASTIVQLFGEAHESEVPSRLILEKQMDLFNNKIGIDYCSDCYSTSNTSISNAILAKLLAGFLRYLNPIDYSGHSNQNSTFWDDPNTTTPDDGHHGINQNPNQPTVLIPTNQ